MSIDVEPVEEPEESQVVSGELVHAPEQSRADRAIARAAEEAFESSGIPGKDEFLALAMQARVMSMSGIVPKALQGKPADVFVVLLTGRDLGIPITSALNQIHVIEGQPTLAPKLLNARLRQLGVGKIVPGERTDMSATAIALGPDGVELGRTTFTWEDAIGAGLVKPDCLPKQHTPKCLNYQSKAWDKCRQGYKTYPQRMLWWRASGWCADDYFPEASLGLYSPEELGAVVDDQGVPIDPGTVELPAGFDTPHLGDDTDPTNDPEDTVKLNATIAALPDDERKALKEQWVSRNLPPVGQLTTAKAQFAWAMVRAHVTNAERAGTMGEVIIPTATAPQEPSEAPEASTTTPAPEDATAAESGPDPVESEPAEEPVADPPADAPPEPVDQELESAIHAVGLMPMRIVDACLAEKGLTKTGNADTRRARLARKLADEAKENPYADEPF